MVMYILQLFNGLMSFSQALFSSRRMVDFPGARALISTNAGKLLPNGVAAISCVGLCRFIWTMVTFSSLEAIVQQYPPPSWLSNSKVRVSLTFNVILFLIVAILVGVKDVFWHKDSLFLNKTNFRGDFYISRLLVKPPLPSVSLLHTLLDTA